MSSTGRILRKNAWEIRHNVVKHVDEAEADNI